MNKYLTTAAYLVIGLVLIVLAFSVGASVLVFLWVWKFVILAVVLGLIVLFGLYLLLIAAYYKYVEKRNERITRKPN